MPVTSGQGHPNDYIKHGELWQTVLYPQVLNAPSDGGALVSNEAQGHYKISTCYFLPR